MSRRAQDLAIPSGFAYLEPYLQKLSRQHPHVDRNVFVMMPFFTPTSGATWGAIPQKLLGSGLTPEQVLRELPDLESEDIKACLRFASRRVDHPVVIH